MKKQNIKAFTLLEILVVIIVLGIIISIGVISVNKIFKKSKDELFLYDAMTILDTAKKMSILDASNSVYKYNINDLLNSKTKSPYGGDLEGEVITACVDDVCENYIYLFDKQNGKTIGVNNKYLKYDELEITDTNPDMIGIKTQLGNIKLGNSDGMSNATIRTYDNDKLCLFQNPSKKFPRLDELTINTLIDISIGKKVNSYDSLILKNDCKTLTILITNSNLKSEIAYHNFKRKVQNLNGDNLKSHPNTNARIRLLSVNDIIDYTENIQSCNFVDGVCKVNLSKSNLSYILHRLWKTKKDSTFNDFWIADEKYCLTTGELTSTEKQDKKCLFITLNEDVDRNSLSDDSVIDITYSKAGNFKNGIFVIDIPLTEIDNYILDK